MHRLSTQGNYPRVHKWWRHAEWLPNPVCWYADFEGSTINDGFDYTHGKDLWKEKLHYTRSWLSAHISDANAIGKPLIVEEFGKAVSAKKVYTGELPHSLMPGEGSRPIPANVLPVRQYTNAKAWVLTAG